MAGGWQRKSDYVWSATRHVGEWLVARMDPQKGETILELAAGPGDTGFAAAKIVGDGGKLLSTDFSQEMVEVARARAAELGVSNAEFEVMNAESMDLEDGSVDAVLCRFALMLMHDPVAALRECARALRSGGKLAFAVWAGPEKNPWVTLTGMIMMQQGHTPQGDPFGPGGMFSMSEHSRIRDMLHETGFAEADIEELDVRWTFEDFEDFWVFLIELAGAVATVIRSLSEDEIEELRHALEDALEDYRSGAGYELPGVALCVAASKP
jgi:ubiquinone/menaquinone biosynthesis C-methylase UbiE